MKQIIPFEKSIVFKSDVANITSISLDHEEKVSNGGWHRGCRSAVCRPWASTESRGSGCAVRS